MFFKKKENREKCEEPACVLEQAMPEQVRVSGPELCACVYSDVGIVRANNEDNFLLDGFFNTSSEDRILQEVEVTQGAAPWHMFAIFDGMGGGERGEEASRIASELFGQAALRLRDGADREMADEMIRKAFLDANNRIVDLQSECAVYGTTGTVLCTNGAVFKLYHLGDSRAYLYRDQGLFQLTRDHTLARMKIDVGIYEAEDPQTQVDKHKLTEYIGRDWTRENLRPVESEWIPLKKEDMVLLCSDGLYDMCPDRLIGELLRLNPSPRASARRLAKAAVLNGGEDNVTCLVIKRT